MYDLDDRLKLLSSKMLRIAIDAILMERCGKFSEILLFRHVVSTWGCLLDFVNTSRVSAGVLWI